MIIESVANQHAEEAAFLWFLRDTAVRGLHFTLDSLFELDSRVDAHLDGLLCAGEDGWKICLDALEDGEAGEFFAAAFLAFESGVQERTGKVLEAGLPFRTLCRGIISALAWLPFQQAEGHIRSLLGDASTGPRRIGLAACVAHRRDPGRRLNEALAASDPMLAPEALKAIGRLGRKDLLPYLLDYLGSQDMELRFSAAWSGAVIGDAGSMAVLKESACAGAFRAEEAAGVVLARMPLPDALEWHGELAAKAGAARLAISGAGVIGDPVLVPWLLERMSAPELARAAGESFAMITGADLASGDLEGGCPEGFEPGPTENPEDEDVSVDPDYDLPWPNPEAVGRWWGENRGRFTSGVRYLLGEPVTSEHLQRVLRNGRHPQRRAAALRLAITNPGQPLFEVRAPGARQKWLLGLR